MQNLSAHISRSVQPLTLPAYLLPGFTLLVFLLRLYLVLDHPGFLGVDGGAYLLSRNAVLGDEPTGIGFPRPPLAPGWLLVPFTAIMGDDIGYKVFSALFSVLPIPAAYLFARLFLSQTLAFFAVVLVAFDLQLAEMLVTGVLPLIGFSLILLVIVAMYKLANDLETEKKWMITIALTLPLIAHINQTSAGIALLVLPGFAILMSATYRGATLILPYRILATPIRLLPITVSATVGLIFALTALPWYISVRPGDGLLNYPGPLIYLSAWSDTAWLLLFWGVVVGGQVFRVGHDHRIRALGLLLVFVSILTVFLSYDESIINIFYRCRYLWPILFIPLVLYLVAPHLSPASQRLRFSLQFITAYTVAVVFIYGSIWTFHRQSAYSDQITPDAQIALEALQYLHPGQAVAVNSFSMSHWVGGLYKVKSPHLWTTEPPKTWTDTDRHLRCLVGWVPGCDVSEASRQLNTRYILIDKRFPYYNERAAGNYLAPENQWEVTEAAEWLKPLYRKNTVVLYAVDTSGMTQSR